MGAAHPGSSIRRVDIDYLRVLALGFLIVYHLMLAYDPFPWRVTSTHAGSWSAYVVATLIPWRMALVFFVGGVAARFMFEKIAAGEFVRERAGKLLVAFAFAVVAIVPLQRFVRLEENGSPSTDYLTYLFTDAPVAISYLGMRLPDFAHVWFLPFLFLYSACVVGLWRFAPGVFAGMQRIIERAPLLVWFVAAMAWFAFIEAVVLPRYPSSGVILTDISAHLHYAPAFLFGALIGKSEAFRAKLRAAGAIIGPVAVAFLLVTLAFVWLSQRNSALWAESLVVRGLYGGAMLFAVLAFAEWALTRPSPALTYANDAILPVYLMHQTALVVTADLITPLAWPLAVELPALLLATTLIPLGLYHALVRHMPWLRRLFGLRPKLRADGGDVISANAQTASR